MNTSNKKNVFTVLIVLFGILIIGVLVYNQDVKTTPSVWIQGMILDAKTGKPIQGVKVSDDRYANGKQYGVTDNNGKYRYQTWPEEHTILVVATGYQNQKKNLDTRFFNTRKEINLDFTLESQ